MGTKIPAGICEAVRQGDVVALAILADVIEEAGEFAPGTSAYGEYFYWIKESPLLERRSWHVTAEVIRRLSGRYRWVGYESRREAYLALAAAMAAVETDAVMAGMMDPGEG